MRVFASMDWGYNAPGCVLWWLCELDGHYHIWHEYKFKGTVATDVASAITQQTKALGIAKLDYLVGDPAMWQHTGAGRGEAIAETLQRMKLPMRKGDNDRKNGWQRVHELLKVAPDGRPWLTVDPSCRYLRRTIAAAMSDKTDADDVNTDSDDHAIDAFRYGAMSRPVAGKRLADVAAFSEFSLGALKRKAQGAVSVLSGREVCVG